MVQSLARVLTKTKTTNKGNITAITTNNGSRNERAKMRWMNAWYERDCRGYRRSRFSFLGLCFAEAHLRIARGQILIL